MRRATPTPFVIVPALIAAAALAGCGAGSSAGHPSVRGVPLAPGARLVSQVRRCDRGAKPFCALQMVLVATRPGSSRALFARQAAVLHRAGWTDMKGYTDHERGAESPRHALRLTYATAQDDLLSFDLGTIKRARPVALSLSRQLFARRPALSLLLEHGSS